MDWTPIILSLIPVAFGVQAVWGRVDKVMKALNELSDVISAVTGALSDKKLTEEEISVIKKEAGEALAAFKAVIK